MIAEIKGKLNKSRFDNAERSEDQLTGNFFGSMRYISFNKGLKEILKKCIFPDELSKKFNCIDCIDEEEWSDKIEFWPRNNHCEPDIFIKFEKESIAILIEVKYNSPLSSDDTVDNNANDSTQEMNESENQLAKQARWLIENNDSQKKFLILLARATDAYEIYPNVSKRNILSNIPFGYITWEAVYDVLEKIDNLDTFESVVVNDLISLLCKKGFDGFRSFKIVDLVVYASKIWKFADYSVAMSNDFSFIIEPKVERSLYYGFR